MYTVGFAQKLELLDLCSCSVPSLENRCLYLKLCHMFKIVNNLC